MYIRELALSDIDQWLDLRLQLWPDASRAELAEDIDLFLAPDAVDVAFVAEDGKGLLVGIIEGSLHAHAPGCVTSAVGYIEGWYVKPDYRRQGIGRALVKRLEGWAKERGCSEMASDTGSDYPLSPAAHESLGYVEVSRYGRGECRVEPGHDEMEYCIHFSKRLHR